MEAEVVGKGVKPTPLSRSTVGQSTRRVLYSPPAPRPGKAVWTIFRVAWAMFFTDFPLFKSLKHRGAAPTSPKCAKGDVVVLMKKGRIGMVRAVKRDGRIKVVELTPADLDAGSFATTISHTVREGDLDVRLRKADFERPVDGQELAEKLEDCMSDLMEYERENGCHLFALDKTLRDGSRRVLCRDPEETFSYSKAFTLLLELVVLVYSLVIQILASTNSSTLLSFLVLKEVFVVSWLVVFVVGMGLCLMLVCGVMLPLYWFTNCLCLPRLTGLSTEKIFDSVFHSVLDEVQVLCEMTLNLSSVRRLFRLSWVLFVRREANPSLRDLEAKFASLTSVVFNMLLVLDMGDTMYHSSVLEMITGDAHKLVLLSLLLSLGLLFKNLSAEKVMLDMHYQAMKDINECNLSTLQTVIYLHRQLDDFLYEPVTSGFLERLREWDFSVGYLKEVHAVVSQFFAERSRSA